jgi:cytochrome c556
MRVQVIDVGIAIDSKGFAASVHKFQQEAPKLLSLAKAKDGVGLKKQVATVGGACKACHHKYRVPEEV